MSGTAEETISAVYNAIYSDVAKAGHNIKAILNSSKVSDHHAIIPTKEIKHYELDTLPEGERKILCLICCRLLCATGEKHIFETVKAEFICNSRVFTSSGKTVTEKGWKIFEEIFRQMFDLKEKDEEKKLPELKNGDTFENCESFVTDHLTQPPKPYTEDTLLAAMEKAGNDDYDTDEVERKGLGTPATRASIIETLITRGYVERSNRQLIPTEKGKKLVEVVPEKLKSAKMTAEWENKLVLVGKGKLDADTFMNDICNFVRNVAQNTEASQGIDVFNDRVYADVLGKCPKCGADIVSGKYGAFCKGKCGMSIGTFFGKNLSDNQVKALLSGDKVYVKDFSGKYGKYNAYLVSDGIEAYSYTNKKGKEVSGFRLKVSLDFSK